MINEGISGALNEAMLKLDRAANTLIASCIVIGMCAALGLAFVIAVYLHG